MEFTKLIILLIMVLNCEVTYIMMKNKGEKILLNKLKISIPG
jgi:hypothetical protein